MHGPLLKDAPARAWDKRLDPSGYYAFSEILREATAKGHGFAVARGVYTKRYGPCPFFERREDAPPGVDATLYRPVLAMPVVPTRVASIDFETRSEADLTAIGSANYAARPSTEVLCMAWALGDEPTALWTPMQGRWSY